MERSALKSESQGKGHTGNRGEREAPEAGEQTELLWSTGCFGDCSQLGGEKPIRILSKGKAEKSVKETEAEVR